MFPHFRVETIDGSAIGGEDFVAYNNVITFEPNEVEKRVSKIYVSHSICTYT